VKGQGGAPEGSFYLGYKGRGNQNSVRPGRVQRSGATKKGRWRNLGFPGGLRGPGVDRVLLCGGEEGLRNFFGGKKGCRRKYYGKRIKREMEVQSCLVRRLTGKKK